MKQNILYLSVLIFILGACHSTVKKQVVQNQQTDIQFKKEGVLSIEDSLGQDKARFDIELAEDDYEQQTGLMYRKSMKDNQAMLFIFKDAQPRYFYMKNTYIPLDIIYIGPNKKIVNIVKEAKVLDETTLPSVKPAQYVLEIKAGLSDQLGLKTGDKVSWQKL
jgi:uncharacterized membrane protein (UPF0127 family)